jgi:Fic family protein
MRRSRQFIHERPEWPRFTWDTDALVSLVAAVRHEQGRLLGRMEALGFGHRAEASLAVLTTDVVKSSAIEGLKLDADEVRSSIARRIGLDVAGLVRSSRHVEGVVEMMLDATRKFEAPLTAQRLFDWHAALFPTGRSGMHEIVVGAWRTRTSGPMQVVSGPMGKERVHFEAPSAERLDVEMARFLEWFNAPPSVDPVLMAAIAHLWFVTIHPFEDGNGRIARAISDLSLARADGTRDRFYSLSSQLEIERTDYYSRLESTQRGDLEITPWLTWFLGCLQRAILGADRTLAAVLHKAAVWRHLSGNPVNERQRIVLNRLLDGFQGFLTTSKYAKLAKCSPDTALRDMQDLQERGLLLRNAGGGRSTSYRLADPRQGGV